MTIRQALLSASQTLQGAGVPDPKLDAGLLLSHITGLARLDLLLRGEQWLTTEQEQRFSSLLLSRAKREPLQYLLEEQSFFGLSFTVDAAVLIPRQETETLCELGVAHLRTLARPAALDLCTGSGAIAVTLAHECAHATVGASDISAEALEIAALNARQNGVSVQLWQGDLFQPMQGMRFDLILSNPPYIPSGECLTLQAEVMREPRMALDGGADGLDFYRRIAAQAYAYLTPRGWLALEVGDGQVESVRVLLEEQGKYRDIRVHNDLYGKLRIVSAYAADPT